MFRKIVCILSAAGVLAAVGIPAGAEQRGSIRIIPDWCGQAVAGGTVAVQSVGKRVEDGYALTDGLADWVFREDEMDSGAALEWIREAYRDQGISKPVTGESGVLFPDLKPGVYLISQGEPAAGYGPFRSFLLTLPSESGWNLTVEPDLISLGDSPKTGDHPSPMIAAMGISFLAAVLMVLCDKGNR